MRIRFHAIALLILAALLLEPSTAPRARDKIDTCTSQKEGRLLELIMQYRKSKGLPAIPVSPSLQKVARVHARDLSLHPPSGKCNMHSWSKNGKWTPCCYTSDHKRANCMWKKPAELSDYTGYGFEISYGGGGTITPEGALRSWQGSSGHNSVIVNAGRWNKKWNAIGAGMAGGYAVVWFGREADPAGAARPCSN